MNIQVEVKLKFQERGRERLGNYATSALLLPLLLVLFGSRQKLIIIKTVCLFLNSNTMKKSKQTSLQFNSSGYIVDLFYFLSFR